MKFRMTILPGRRVSDTVCSDYLPGLPWEECNGSNEYAVEAQRVGSAIWTTLVEFNGSDNHAAFFSVVLVARCADVAVRAA